MTEVVTVIASVKNVPSLRILPHAFVVNLAVYDLLVNIFIDGFAIPGVIFGRSFFEKIPGLCEVVAMCCLWGCTGSLWTMAVIAFNRYTAVCRRSLYCRFFFNKTHIIAWCTVIWVGVFLVDFPNFGAVGWGNHGFDDKMQICVWDQSASLSYSSFYASVAIFVPMALLVACYIPTMRVIRQKATGRSEKLGSENTRDHRLAYSLLVIIILFALLWLPYAFLITIDHSQEWSYQVYLLLIIMAHLNSSLNWMVYAIINPKFLQGYKTTLRRFFCLPEKVKSQGHQLTLSEGRYQIPTTPLCRGTKSEIQPLSPPANATLGTSSV